MSPEQEERHADTVSVPVVEEQLEVGRRRVETGHVLRVRKEVDEQAVHLEEPLEHEWFEVERVPVERVLDGPVAPREEGDMLVLPVVEERLVLTKQLVLVEEVRLTRRREHKHGTVQGHVRRERVVVERFDPTTGRWQLESDGAEPPPSGTGPPRR